MPQRRAAAAKRALSQATGGRTPLRYSVGFPSALAKQVENYAKMSDVSVSKAITALVRIGLQGQETRKREFFSKLRKNLANKDPKLEDQMVDEFRDLILGR